MSWNCRSCGTSTWDTRAECRGCGAPQSAAMPSAALQPIEALIISVQPPAHLEHLRAAAAAPAALAATPAAAPEQAPPPPAAGAAEVQVVIPTGMARGQQVQFTTPDGQAMTATAREDIPAGGHLLVQYQPHAALPSAFAAELDRRAGKWGWVMYGLGWAMCGISPICTPVVWLVVAASYYLKPEAQRSQTPSARGPAVAALATCAVLALLCLVGLAVAVTGFAMSGGFDHLHPVTGGGGHHPGSGNVATTFHGMGVVEKVHLAAMRPRWMPVAAGNRTAVTAGVF